MAIDGQSFARRNRVFTGRDLGVIEAALDRARLTVSLSRCVDARGGDAVAGEALYDAIVEADACVQLYADPNGMPTSLTKGSDIAKEAKEHLKKLKRLATPRMAVVGGIR